MSLFYKEHSKYMCKIFIKNEHNLLLVSIASNELPYMQSACTLRLIYGDQNAYLSTVLATAKLTSFSFLLKNEDAYFRERKRIFQRTKTQKKRKRKKKTKTQKKRKRRKKTHNNDGAKRRISIGALYKSLQIINSSFIY